jgi:hypothetical protein
MIGISAENYSKFTGRATGTVTGKCHTFIHPHKIQNVLKIATLLGHGVPDITNIILILGNTKKKTPWSESASELYRPSDRRLSAK